MNEPLKESIDYPDFVKKFVKERLAELDKSVTADLEEFIRQDVESYLLDVKKSAQDLSPAEIRQINEFILERVNEAGGF